MPYNGSGVFENLPGIEGAPNTVIESAKWNSFLADNEQAHNTKRPIVGGGTGADSALGGWDALSAKGADIASTSTINLTTATGPRVDIAGTNAISAVTMPDGAFRIARATGIFQLTASATLVVNRSTTTNYTTAVGDLMFFYRDGSAVSVSVIGSGVSYFPTGHIWGFTLSNGTDATNDINVAIGTCRSEGDTANIKSSTAFGKQLDVVYAAGGTTGSPTGGRFDTSISDGTWHTFVISNGTTVGCGFSKNLNPTGEANYPSGYTEYRRIGSIVRTGGAIKTFTQVGDFFQWNPPASDVDVSNLGASDTNYAISVPLGLSVRAKLDCYITNTGSVAHVRIDNPLLSSRGAVSDTIGNLGNIRSTNTNLAIEGELDVYTDTSAQVRARAIGASTILKILTVGYNDARGR